MSLWFGEEVQEMLWSLRGMITVLEIPELKETLQDLARRLAEMRVYL